MSEIHAIYSTKETLELTYTLTQKVLNIKGDLIECGVAGGSQIAMMKKCLIDNGVKKDVYGYDSFEGIPYASDNDNLQPGLPTMDRTKLGLLESTGVSAHSMQNVKDNFSSWGIPLDNVHLVKGWFQNTIHLNKHKSIALLRLDGDLYESTKIPLQYFYDKIPSGGIIIIDDWQLYGCRKAVLEFIDQSDIIEHYEIAYVIKK